MRIIVDESPVGVGKTYEAIKRMVDIPGHYVFAVERVDAIHEMTSRIFAQASQSTKLPVVERIFGGNGQIGSVARQIADLPRRMNGHDHVIAIISHEGMMMSDFEAFEGWSLIVDEVPSMFSMNKYRTNTDVAFFEANYTLTPVDGADGRWRLVGLTKAGAALDASAISDCEGHRYLHHFHRRCSDPRMGPVVDLKSWEEMAEPHREWVWWSLFHPSQIASFSSISFLGSNFSKSLTFAMFDSSDIEWQTNSHWGSRPLHNKHVRIIYYSDRPTSKFYLRSTEGQDDLATIGEHISATTSLPLFWSANEAFKAALEPSLGNDHYRLPRQAGTSSLMGYHRAAMFYAAKPSHEVESAINGLGCTALQWVATNEHEIILQFLTRTSVRDVSSTHDVVLHVFNREQAEYLTSFFDAQPHITSTLDKVVLPLSTQNKKAAGRPLVIMTEAERAAKKAAANEKRKLAMRERRWRKLALV